MGRADRKTQTVMAAKSVHRIKAPPAAIRASGICVVVWSIRSQPVATDERIVVSEIGEHWSPKTLPPLTAPKHRARKVGSGCTAQARGMLTGNRTA